MKSFSLFYARDCSFFKSLCSALHRRQEFPFVPVRELSSTLFCRESRAFRKSDFELWSTSLLLHTLWHHMLSQMSPPDLPVPLSLPPSSKTKNISETIFPIMFVNEVRIWSFSSAKAVWLTASEPQVNTPIFPNTRRRLLMMTQQPRWGHCSSSWLSCPTSPSSSWAWASSCCWCSSSCSAETARRR